VHPAANNLNTVDERHLVPAPDHVDWVVFAAVPLELYLQTKEERYRKVGLVMTDWQWAYPDYGFPFEHPVLQRYFPDRITPEALDWYARGYTWQTRLWIDDMYMISAAQTQAYRATGDHKYIDRAAKEMVLYLERLQRPNGLFYHHPDTPYYWGRGNGWMAAGCAELLRALPEDNPDRPAIMAGYRKMMAALLHYQDADGMWHQLVDDPAAWPETSGTGMFTFAFITGVNHGWLDEATYGSAARRAWLALADYINADGDVGQVCRGSNIYNPRDPEHGPDGRAYYLACRRNTGDLHGQAPVLWCATAWMRDGK
jgi:rhamnogalacturonyl hydrolase YesR